MGIITHTVSSADIGSTSEAKGTIGMGMSAWLDSALKSWADAPKPNHGLITRFAYFPHPITSKSTLWTILPSDEISMSRTDAWITGI